MYLHTHTTLSIHNLLTDYQKLCPHEDTKANVLARHNLAQSVVQNHCELAKLCFKSEAAQSRAAHIKALCSLTLHFSIGGLSRSSEIR